MPTVGGGIAGITSAPAPALENVIHGVFVVADLLRTDRLAGTAVRLARAQGDFSDSASEAYNVWLQALSAQTAKAQEQR